VLGRVQDIEVQSRILRSYAGQQPPDVAGRRAVQATEALLDRQAGDRSASARPRCHPELTRRSPGTLNRVIRVADYLEHDALRGDMVPVPAQPRRQTPLPLLDLRELTPPSPPGWWLVLCRG
jgi:hypothetical protein